jgi:hypothetical protein
LFCLYKSASQQLATAAQKCFILSRHCAMIFSRRQNTPYLEQRERVTSSIVHSS